MAEWPILGDGTGDGGDQKRASVQGDEDDENRVMVRQINDDGLLRDLFDKVLSDLQIGFNVKTNNKRPTRAVLGNGQSVDLFKLFWLVKEGGGLDLVSNQCQWGSIGVQLGFNAKVSASLKLIYTKYLDILDRCLSRIFRDGSLCKNTQEDDGNLGLLALELTKRFQGQSNCENERKMNLGDNVKSLSRCKISEQSDISLNESIQIPHNLGGKINDLGGDITKTSSGDICDNNLVKIVGKEKCSTPDTSIVERQMISRKRKREGLDQMLKWMYLVAKNPFDPRIRKIPNSSKWKENKGKESWSLALVMRESLLRRKYPDSDHICPSLEQKKQRVTPSMYDDFSATRHPHGPRFSSRIPILAKTPLCSCCRRSMHKQSNLPTNSKHSIHHPNIKEIDQSPLAIMKSSLAIIEPPLTPVDVELSPLEQQQRIRKRVTVNVGPRYQAEIPSWTGKISESDSRWLGTLVWTPKSKNLVDNSRRSLSATEEPIGKVCDKTCDCQFSGSVECVRFHIAEKRLKLKLELGRAFYQWKFNTMGEIVSLSWSPEEEEKFKEVMTSSPMLLRGKSTFLHKKTRKDLVDYYFNVFLQRKRCYQNRTTPREVDSDDELSDFGAVGGLYGDVAIRASVSNPRACTLNEQCWDLFNEEVS